MFRTTFIAAVATMLTACGAATKFDPASVEDAGGRIARVEPLSWWVGMQTPLCLLVNGDNIAACDVRVEGGRGVEVKAVHKADSPNYLFVDVVVKPNAEAGRYWLVFSDGEREFKRAYDIAGRAAGSAERGSFTAADVIYLLMPDRFANGDEANDSTADMSEKAARDEFYGRHGGDIQGMIDHLDYIADLGATTVWSTPLLEDNQPQESYHGYACTDYYRIDPRFGSNELYREYVERAHEKGLKVMMDIVTNHCGTAHWWMEDLPFKDWVHLFPEYTGTNICFSTNMDTNASKHDLNVQESGWFVPSMPDMNLDNPYTLAYFKQWAVWWIEYAGLDGLRVDTYPYNEKEPMSEWCRAVRREYPHLNIVGECWTSSAPQLAFWQGGNPNKDGFDTSLPAIMDFPLFDAICAALPCDNPGWGQGMTRIYDCLSHDFVYHDLGNMMIFADNHDVNRIGDTTGGNIRRQKIAMAMMATMRGIPQLFYGDEMMFRSADLSQWHGGLRVDFPGGWAGDKENFFTAEGRAAAGHNTDGKRVKAGQIAGMHDFTRTLLQWRKGKEVIHSGKTLHFMTRDNTYAYFRYNDTDAVFVYINNSPEPRRIPWENYAEIGATLTRGRNVVTGEAVTVDAGTVAEPQSVLIVEYKR